jgi:hypothetical protein
MIPGERSPYQRTANDNGERVTAQQLVGTFVGAPVTNAVAGASPASFSTAPYVPPLSHAVKRLGFCKAKGDTCKARAIRGTELCIFHSPGQGRRDRIGVLEHEGLAE